MSEGMLSIPQDGKTTPALATAPDQAEVAKPLEGMKPLTREMARMQTSDEVLKRQRAIGAFTKVYSGVVRDKVQEFREEIVDFIRRVKDGEIAVYDPKGQRCAGIKEATPVVYGFCYSYLCEILRGGKKRAAPRKKKATPEETGGADAVSEAIPAIDFAHLPKGFDWGQVHGRLSRKQKLECLEDVLMQLGLCTTAVSGVMALVYKAERAAKARLRMARVTEKKAVADEALIARGAALAEESPEGSIGPQRMRDALGVSTSKFFWLSTRAEKEGRWLRVGLSGNYCSRSLYEKLTKPNTEEEQAAVDASIQESMQEAMARAEGGRVVIR